MSSFVVSNKHILTMLSYMEINSAYPLYTRFPGAEKLSYQSGDDLQKMAEELLAENIRAVNTRYNEDAPMIPIRYSYQPGASEISPVQIIKLCRCYCYQASDDPDFEETLAYKIAKDIESEAISNLPGYEEAAWDI